VIIHLAASPTGQPACRIVVIENSHVYGQAFSLPHAVVYDDPAVLGAMTCIAQALRDIGMPVDGSEEAAKTAMAAPLWTRPLDEDALRDLLTRAWNGDPPRS